MGARTTAFPSEVEQEVNHLVDNRVDDIRQAQVDQEKEIDVLKTSSTAHGRRLDKLKEIIDECSDEIARIGGELEGSKAIFAQDKVVKELGKKLQTLSKVVETTTHNVVELREEIAHCKQDLKASKAIFKSRVEKTYNHLRRLAGVARQAYAMSETLRRHDVEILQNAEVHAQQLEEIRQNVVELNEKSQEVDHRRVELEHERSQVERLLGWLFERQAAQSAVENRPGISLAAELGIDDPPSASTEGGSTWPFWLWYRNSTIGAATIDTSNSALETGDQSMWKQIGVSGRHALLLFSGVFLLGIFWFQLKDREPMPTFATIEAVPITASSNGPDGRGTQHSTAKALVVETQGPVGLTSGCSAVEIIGFALTTPSAEVIFDDASVAGTVDVAQTVVVEETQATVKLADAVLTTMVEGASGAVVLTDLSTTEAKGALGKRGRASNGPSHLRLRRHRKVR